MTKKFPKLINNIKPKNQDIQRSSSRINSKSNRYLGRLYTNGENK